MKVKQIVMSALGIASIFLMTLIHIPLPFGYFNVGDVAVLLFASILSPLFALLVGGLGSALADLYLGYSQYAIFTFVIKGMMGLMVAIILKRSNKYTVMIAYIIAVTWMVVGYFLVDWLLLGNAIATLPAVQGNILQAIVNVILSFFVYQGMKDKIEYLKVK